MRSKFSFDTSHGRGRRGLLYATLLVLALLTLDVFTGGSVRSVVRAGASAVLSPIRAINSSIADGAFSSRDSLARENALLREQLDKAAERAAAYQVLIQENHDLRLLVDLSKTDTGTAAPIVSSVRSSPYGTFLIGVEAGDAIGRGSYVLTEGGFVVGLVDEINGRTALVTEVFAGGAEIDASIKGVASLAVGRGGGNAIAELPRDAEVAIGDPVITPRFGGRPIGTVGQIERDPSSASQTVYISLPVNLASLRYVYVVPIQ